MKKIGKTVGLGLATLILMANNSQAVRRPSAARALRIQWPAGTSAATQLQPVARRDEKSGRLQLFFTWTADGTRNLWKAEPAEDAKGEIEWKNIRWQAAPLTRLNVPRWADAANPVSEGGLLCASNALRASSQTSALAARPQNGSDEIDGAKNSSQIVYLEIESGRAWPLTTGVRDTAPAISPARRQLAFVSDRAGFESIFVMPVGELPPRQKLAPSIENSARRVATLARHPIWIDENTLLFQSVRPGSLGLYRLDLSEKNSTQPQLVLSGRARDLRDVALSPDRRSIAVVADATDETGAEQSKIYLLASDGSGLRAVAGTEGAAHPFFAPDNAALFFDKPLPGENTPALWMIPLVEDTPLVDSPLADSPMANVSDAPRLSVDSLPAPAISADAPLQIDAPTFSGATPATITVASPPVPIQMPAPPQPRIAAPRDDSHLVPMLPLPALPPAPREDVSTKESTAPPGSTAPRGSTPAPTINITPTIGVVSPLEVAPFSPSKLPALQFPNVALKDVEKKDEGKPEGAKSEIVLSNGYDAKLDVSGVPNELRVGGSVEVQFAAQNIGRNGWFVGGAAPSRIFYRWTDAATGFRARWAYRWLPGNVAPRAQTRLSLSINAPPRAGNFRLDIGLLSMPNGRYSPPPATARAASWPGEFGVVSFDVTAR